MAPWISELILNVVDHCLNALATEIAIHAAHALGDFLATFHM